jgi:catechol 2,3-dioxygenase-like lactoylglutathione lyase family enzyme
MMRADRRPALHHVLTAMPAGGEDAVRRFYGDLLGLTEIAKPEVLRARGSVWFRTGTLQLHLGVVPDFCPATKAHVALEVTDLGAIRERCRAAGNPVREDGDLPGYARFYVDDPFGNRVEILQPLESTASIVDYLMQGPDLDDLDLTRDRSPMRDIDLS